MVGNRRTRVLIVDDSAIVRKILSDVLAGEPDFEVVGTAPDPFVARDKILSLKPDVLTLDIEMPRMDGLTFLRKLMHFHPLPTVVVSSLVQHSTRAAIQALELGAVEVLPKPAGPYSVGDLKSSLAAKLRAAASARIRHGRASGSAFPLAEMPVASTRGVAGRDIAVPARSIIAIGASTGGTEAIATVLSKLPRECPPILIAQHIPPVFSREFANRLNEICVIRVREAADNDVLAPGLALIAPGDYHMLLRKAGDQFRVTVKSGPRVCFQRPSVDVLFTSIAEIAGASTVGVLLTGMGSDGAQGLLKLRKNGAHTICQDEATCVVYGMPREAVELEAAAQVLPLHEVASAILAPRRIAAGG